MPTFKKGFNTSVRSLGFTLIELLIVITIIAILSAIGVTAYSSVSSKARDARRRSDIKAIVTAIEVNYNTANKQYKCPINPATAFSNGQMPIDPLDGEKKCKFGSDNIKETCYYCIGGSTLLSCSNAAYGTGLDIKNYLISPVCSLVTGSKICSNLEDGTAYCLSLTQ